MDLGKVRYGLGRLDTAGKSWIQIWENLDRDGKVWIGIERLDMDWEGLDRDGKGWIRIWERSDTDAKVTPRSPTP